MSTIHLTGANTELPQTEEMKTQKIYTGSARNVRDALSRKVGRTMMMHGPPSLSLQDQKENKPIPKMPMPTGGHATRQHFEGNTLFTTRGKVSELSKALNSEIPNVGPLPLTSKRGTENGVHLKRFNNVKNHNHPPFLVEPSRPNSLIEAERMANRMIELGNFSTFGEDTNMRA